MNEVSQRAAFAMAGLTDIAVPNASGKRIGERDARLDPRLVSAAHQFEASLMQELLKPLSESEDSGEDEQSGVGGFSGLTSSSEGSGSALMSFGSEALAKALSEKGGLGVACRILDHFEDSSLVRSTARSSPGGTARKSQDGTSVHY